MTISDNLEKIIKHYNSLKGKRVRLYGTTQTEENVFPYGTIKDHINGKTLITAIDSTTNEAKDITVSIYLVYK